MRRVITALLFVFAVACSEPYAARPPATGSPANASPREPDPRAAVPPAANEPPVDPLAGELRYVEIVLGDAKPDDRLPMIVAVHGLGDDPRNFAHLFDTFTEPARLILPQGIDSSPGGGWSWFPFRARDPDVAALSASIGDAADKLAVSIGILAKSRNTAGKPILTGFSQGGMLSFAVAVRHPDSIGIALPVGGWLPPPLVPAARAPKGAPAIVAFHGTDDPAVKFEPTRAAVTALEQLGWSAKLVDYEGVGHVITPELQRDLFDRIVDGVRGAAKTKP